MATRTRMVTAARWLAGVAAIGVGGYAATAAALWMRDGHPAAARGDRRVGGAGGTIFRTETRARATDAAARARFRRYWACFSPGMWLIRWTMLGPLAEAARARSAA